MRLFGHPRAELALAADGRLDAAAERRLDAHLARCPRCRAELAEIEVAARALRRDAAASPPAALRARLLADARRELPGRGARPFSPAPGRTRRLAFAAGFGLAVAVAAAVTLVPARVRVVQFTERESAFEQRALTAHRTLAGESPELDLSSGDAAAIRAWLRDQGGLSAALVGERSGADAARYRLLGVRAVGENGRPAAAIATRIDGAAATLLVGRERDVEGIPAWGWLGKQLLVRRDPVSGVHRMSWRNAGKAYTLVTDPGVSPELACQLCHVDARRRKAIARVAEQL
jgi:anti-sigma factor RsiW